MWNPFNSNKLKEEKENIRIKMENENLIKIQEKKASIEREMSHKSYTTKEQLEEFEELKRQITGIKNNPINQPYYGGTYSGKGITLNNASLGSYWQSNSQPITGSLSQGHMTSHFNSKEANAIALLKMKGIRVVSKEIAKALGLSSCFLYEEDELMNKEENKIKKPRKRLKI